jgi:hypothetical protein
MSLHSFPSNVCLIVQRTAEICAVLFEHKCITAHTVMQGFYDPKSFHS